MVVLDLRVPIAVFSLLIAGCTQPDGAQPDGAQPGDGDDLDAIARDYIELVLGVGEHDSDFVDAYYGAESVRESVRERAPDLTSLAEQAAALEARLSAFAPAEDALLFDVLRHRYLEAQTHAVSTRVRMLEGAELRFDEESAALYDAVAPHRDDEELERLAADLDARLAAEGWADGSIGERYAAFMSEFTIPPDRVDQVFRTAIEACRARTLARIDLPPEESFTVEYVTDKPWSAYNWYQGGYKSLIQVNLDLPITIDRAVDLACHEGYPGHHVYNLLLEKHLVNERGWPEYQVYPLFSPQSLIAEGTANFGVEMAFPGAERLAYERDELFALAGLDPSRADVYEAVGDLARRLRYAGNEAARRYLDGHIDAEQAADYLVRFAAMSPERAAQRVRFIDRYRSYVINYNLGADLVADAIDRQAGDDPDARWARFEELLSSPRLPSDLAPK